ncbi:C-C motif chemokine 26-like [Engraulis encrasicolus]|uniref:C-C motif chemokine 26-like n=1 Tax=Engraulis encrasicolus TaxID=184585 RepID=UPI002FD073ED
MMTRIALLLLIAASLYCTVTAGTGSGIARDCCLSINPKVLPRKLAASYMLSDPGCNLKATVFTTKKGVHVCAPPPEESEWVSKLIAWLDRQ